MKNIRTWLICSAIWMFAVAGLFYFMQQRAGIDITDTLQTVVVSNIEMGVGHVISEDDVRIDSVFSRNIVGGAVKNSVVIGAVVHRDININEQLTYNRIVLKEDVVEGDGLREYSIPITIGNSVANRVAIGEYVELWVSYGEERKAELIFSQKRVVDLVSSSGVSVGRVTNLLPAYAVFLLDKDNISIIDNAISRGEVFLTRIPVGLIELNTESFVPVWGGGE